tara:strand:+ start:638 stop:883 length:246 start_codon:yes stop_codon:yes gene_type:complete
MNKDLYEIKVVSGSKDGVDNFVKHELQEYPKKDYGTVILDLDETAFIKTVRIIRFKTKDLYDGQELNFTPGEYPFDSGVSL